MDVGFFFFWGEEGSDEGKDGKKRSGDGGRKGRGEGKEGFNQIFKHPDFPILKFLAELFPLFFFLFSFHRSSHIAHKHPFSNPSDLPQDRKSPG